MKKTVLKLAVVTLVSGLALPAVSRAADDDLQQKMNALTKEVQELRKSVNMTEEKSLSKWLTISGDYRFRVDSMHGQTVAYTNPGKIFTDPTVIAAFTQAGIDTMKTNMRNTTTYAGAIASVPMKEAHNVYATFEVKF